MDRWQESVEARIGSGSQASEKMLLTAAAKLYRLEFMRQSTYMYLSKYCMFMCRVTENQPTKQALNICFRTWVIFMLSVDHNWLDHSLTPGIVLTYICCMYIHA